MRESFTPLEQAAFDYVCLQFPDDRTALTAQLVTAKVLRHENTGTGFYTYFKVGGGMPLAGEDLRNAGNTRIEGLNHGMGFILWLKDGYADHLEGFTYDDSTVNIDFTAVNFGTFFG